MYEQREIFLVQLYQVLMMVSIACSSVQVSDDGQYTQDSLVSGMFQKTHRFHN
jgi:hypothetical protein